MKKIVVLNSGGFDSTMLLKYLGESYKGVELHSLYFSYGQPNDVPAAECAKYNADKYCVSHKVINIPKIDWTQGDYFKAEYTTLEKHYLEARNLIFASYAVSYAESINADTVAMAFIKDGVDSFKDASNRFSKKLDRLFREFNISFKAPLISYWKEDLFNAGVEFGVEPDSFFSCDVPIQHKPCGKCPDCEAIEKYKKMYYAK